MRATVAVVETRPETVDQDLERVLGKDVLVEVVGHESTDVVPAEAVGHLSQVVGAVGEELGVLSHLVGGQGRPRDLDHRPKLVINADTLLGHHLLGFVLQGGLLSLQLIDMAGQGNHHLGMGLKSFFLDLAGGLKDSPDLHSGQSRQVNAQAHPTQAKHRVGFVHPLDCLQHLFLFGQSGRVLAGDLQLGNFAE